MMPLGSMATSLFLMIRLFGFNQNGFITSNEVFYLMYHNIIFSLV